MYYLAIFIIGLIILYALYVFFTRPSLLSAEQQKKRFQKTDRFVILWDIHGVLFTKSILHWIYLFISYPRLLEIIWDLNREIIVLFCKYIAAKLKLSRQEITNQEMIEAAIRTKNDALVQLVMRISCDYKPNFATIALVKALNTHQFTQHIGSNIGITIFEKFYTMYESIFALFTEYFVVRIIPGKPVYKKPLPSFFTTYLEQQQRNAHDIIFIDDTVANVATAQSLGITALLYTTPEQLRADLTTLGLF